MKRICAIIALCTLSTILVGLAEYHFPPEDIQALEAELERAGGIPEAWKTANDPMSRVKHPTPVYIPPHPPFFMKKSK